MRTYVLTALSNKIIFFQAVAPSTSARVTSHILQNLLPATHSSETLEQILHELKFGKANIYSHMIIAHIHESNT